MTAHDASRAFDFPAHWSSWRKANYRYFEEHLAALSSQLHLVDFGAGPLQFKNLFTRFKYTGVDFENFPHISVVADLAKDIPIANSAADIVTLSNTVEHVPNTEHLFKECKRILKRGGIIIGTIPFLMQIHQAPYDFNRYTHYQIRRFLSDAGFSDIEVVPLGSLIDAYNTMELKFFDHLEKQKPGFITRISRIVRRGAMRILRHLFSDVPATERYAEGYGFRAIA